MKTRRGGMWGVSQTDIETVDRKVRDIVQLYHLGDIPLRSPNSHKTEDREFEVELMDILSGTKRKELNKILQKLRTYHGSERIIPMITRLYIRTLTGGKRKTKRGGWPWSTSPSKEDVFADEIIANLFNENYPFTEKINNYNLQKVMAKLIEKGESSEGEKRNKIIARLKQMNAKNNGYERNAWSLSKMI